MNKPPRIIGLTGQKESGKSSVAYILKSYTRLSFASPIKRMLSAMGVTDEELVDKERFLPRFGQTTRYMLQTLGTEWGRNLVAQDHWINIAKREAQDCLNRGMLVVFDDVRFDNEAQVIRDLGGEVWRIERGHIASDGHISEHGISRSFVDAVIYNVGTKQQLTEHVLSLVGFEQGVVCS